MTTKRFYEVCGPLFTGGINADKKTGIERIVAGCKAYRVDRQGTAYVLATSFHETGQRMQPVTEGLNYSATGLRSTWPTRFKTDEDAEKLQRQPVNIANRVYANRLGNGDEASGDGWKYRGRGDVQITGAINYGKFGRITGVDLVSNPDRALDPDISVKILVIGMQRGMFTGVSLDDVSEPATSEPDFDNDRAIVNGKDRAVKIAAYAQVYYDALEGIDLLSESRVVKAAQSTSKTSVGGILAGAGAAVTQVIAENQQEILGAGQTGVTLGKFLPWLAVALPAIMVVLFVINRVNAKRAEAARREDHEKNGA